MNEPIEKANLLIRVRPTTKEKLRQLGFAKKMNTPALIEWLVSQVKETV